jgi:hypothetical protein
VGCADPFGIVPANTLRILSSAALVNHRFRAGKLSRRTDPVILALRSSNAVN